MENEEPRLFPRGDNNEVAKKKTFTEFKNLFSQQPLGQFLPNLEQSIVW